MSEIQTWKVDNLSCSVCAQKIEDALSNTPGVAMARVDFAAKQITIHTEKEQDKHFTKSLTKIAKQVEPALKISLHSENEKPARNYQAIRVVIALLLFLVGLLYKQNLLFIASWVIGGYEVLYRAFKNILHGKIFDEYFLMTVATIGAIAIGEIGEAAAVMLFYLIGEYFQESAVQKSRKSILKTLDLQTKQARVVQGREIKMVDCQDVEIGTILRVLPGEKIPLDGNVVTGSTTLDLSSLTGESLPQTREEGEPVLSGSVNLSAAIEIQTTKRYEQSTATKIMELITQSSHHKAPTERFITSFARYYTPIVVLIALVLAVVPPLFGGAWQTWIYRSLVFLVVSCPCALVISVPLTYFGALGRSAREGILIKGGNFIEAVHSSDAILFDKTGTLTTGEFRVTHSEPLGSAKYDKQYLVQLVSALQRMSTHPLARAFDGYETPFTATQSSEIAGKGIQGIVDGKHITLGNARLISELGIKSGQLQFDDSMVFLSVEGELSAAFTLSDTLRSDAKYTIQSLRKRGIRFMALISGDSTQAVKQVADELSLDAYEARLLPHEKFSVVKKLSEKHPKMMYVGDGMNDAPTLASSKVGIAMGYNATDAARQSSDIVIASDTLSKLHTLIQISDKTATLARQNIALALGVKALVMLLGVFGFATMWLAVLADTGVTILAVLNALRILLYRVKR